MHWFDPWERKLRRFAVPNVTVGLIVCQVLAYGAWFADKEALDKLTFVPSLFLAGEWWRAVTFLVMPPETHPFFAFLAWYFFYLMGTALENHWGTLRYNIFLLVGWLATIGAALAVAPWAGDVPATNGYFEASVFLAFAWLYPDFVIQLFFILPVKIKWLALLTWVVYFFTFVFGGWLERVLVLAAISNFLLFFGTAIVRRVARGHRHMTAQAKSIANRHKPFHVCTVCGITDRTNPDMDFRYCPSCAGTRGYCTAHIRDHEHITADEGAARP
jgi:hypothetical protein